MNISLTTSKTLVSDEIRTAYKQVIRDEIAARDPAQGIKILFDDEPPQLKFDFKIHKK